ncbi:MAG: hypothetical protein HFJ10_15310 [Lachnospiraceae bacterium]|nr:hypothetical protein [Lachnospiraceae bacterium]
MSNLSLFYTVLSLIIIIYSVNHRLDLLCVAAICYIVYSMYCIPGIGISGQYRPKLSDSLYCSVYIQLVLLIIFIGITRYYERRKDHSLRSNVVPTINNNQEKILKISFRIYTAIIVIFAFANIIPIGISGFATGKSTVWEQTNVFYIISLYGAYPSFAYGIHKNDKLVWIPSLLIELTIFFAGSRAFTATIIVIFLCEKGTALWKNKKGNWKLFVLGALGIVFLLMYRMVDQYVMAGDLQGAIDTLKDPLTWLTALEFNEPRVIIANYDYVFTSGVRFPLGDIIYRIIDFIPGMTWIFSFRLSYPEYFSTWLMDEVHGSTGVGGSIWGESYAMFGYIGVILFTLLWLLMINKCNKHLDYHKKHSYFLVSLGTYLAWYINRLDFNRVAQACKVLLFCYLIWAIIFLAFGGTLEIGKFKYSFKRKSVIGT